jgi:hypothetical protein
VTAEHNYRSQTSRYEKNLSFGIPRPAYKLLHIVVFIVRIKNYTLWYQLAYTYTYCYREPAVCLGGVRREGIWDSAVGLEIRQRAGRLGFQILAAAGDIYLFFRKLSHLFWDPLGLLLSGYRALSRG